MLQAALPVASAARGAPSVPPSQPRHGFEEASVRVIHLHGRPDRYLRFYGWTVLRDGRGLWPRPRPGGRPSDGVLASRAGRREFTYDVDCLERTFNRHGDGSWLHRPGWLPVDRDLTAALVAERYCPVLESLRRPPLGKTES